MTVYRLEVEPASPRALAIVSDALKVQGVDVTFDSSEQQRSADQVFGVARAVFELAGDIALTKAAIAGAAARWPGLKVRLVELGKAGRHER